MRELADEAHIERFMRALGRVASAEGRVYLTGGATAVLHGWRSEELNLNLELAAPSDFIPIPTGWEERSPLIRKEGRLSFHQFDLLA